MLLTTLQIKNSVFNRISSKFSKFVAAKIYFSQIVDLSSYYPRQTKRPRPRSRNDFGRASRGSASSITDRRFVSPRPLESLPLIQRTHQRRRKTYLRPRISPFIKRSKPPKSHASSALTRSKTERLRSHRENVQARQLAFDWIDELRRVPGSD